MKKYFNYILILSVVIAFFTGCVKDLTGTVYTGPDLVEIYGTSLPLAKTITTTTTPKLDSFLVQLVGKQRSTATNVTFVVDASSTAVVTTDYVINTPSPVVLPANASSVWIKFMFNKVSSQKTLIINLTGGDNVQPSQNYKTFTFTLK
jgi:hypothetical protein